MKTKATLGVSGLEGEEEEEEGRVAGFLLQGKKVISTGFTPRQVFVLFPLTLAEVTANETNGFQMNAPSSKIEWIALTVKN